MNATADYRNRIDKYMNVTSQYMNGMEIYRNGTSQHMNGMASYRNGIDYDRNGTDHNCRRTPQETHKNRENTPFSLKNR